MAKASRVSARTKVQRERKSRPPMSVILHDVPPGFDWGWYSREDPRMHLQVVDEEHKVLGYKFWLEQNGKRIFEPEGTISAKILRSLQAVVSSKRRAIDDRWVSFMIRKNWLQCHFAGSQVTLVAYPGTPNSFTRTIDLRLHLTAENIAALRPKDIRLNDALASVEIWPHLPADEREDIRISTNLWE